MVHLQFVLVIRVEANSLGIHVISQVLKALRDDNIPLMHNDKETADNGAGNGVRVKLTYSCY